MNRIFTILIATMFFSGCTQWKKLTNSEGKEDHVEQIQGIWTGSISYAGYAPNVNFNMTQDDRTLDGYLSIGYTGIVMAHIVNGHIYDHDFSMTFSPTPRCGSAFTASGEAREGVMVVTFVGCTDTELNQTISLGR